MAEHWTHGADLKLARERKQLSQDDAARLVGVKVGAWGAWERGQQVPQLERLAKIVEVLEVPPSLIGYEAPAGWELVPSEWIRAEFTQITTALADLNEAIRAR